MEVSELYDFLADLFDSYKSVYDAGIATARMKEVWSYTATLIADEKERSRVLKTIIKAKDEPRYRDAVLAARRSFSDSDH